MVPSATCLLCRREISEDVSRLVETTDEFERPQSAPPLFADGISGGFALVRATFAPSCWRLELVHNFGLHTIHCVSGMITTMVSSVAQQQNGNGLAGYPSGGLSAADTYTDIRYDEHYEKFYQSAAAGDSGLKLPPPLEQRTLYHELPRFSQPHGGDTAAGLRPSSAVNLSGSYAGTLHTSLVS